MTDDNGLSQNTAACFDVEVFFAQSPFWVVYMAASTRRITLLLK